MHPNSSEMLGQTKKTTNVKNPYDIPLYFLVHKHPDNP